MNWIGWCLAIVGAVIGGALFVVLVALAASWDDDILWREERDHRRPWEIQ